VSQCAKKQGQSKYTAITPSNSSVIRSLRQVGLAILDCGPIIGGSELERSLQSWVTPSRIPNKKTDIQTIMDSRSEKCRTSVIGDGYSFSAIPSSVSMRPVHSNGSLFSADHRRITFTVLIIPNHDKLSQTPAASDSMLFTP
jgi:hypothetical protein